MSIQDYESLRRARPDLKLPVYQLLSRPARKRLRRLGTRQELIARATGIVLRMEPGWEWGDQIIQRRRLIKASHPTTTLKAANGKRKQSGREHRA